MSSKFRMPLAPRRPTQLALLSVLTMCFGMFRHSWPLSRRVWTKTTRFVFSITTSSLLTTIPMADTERADSEQRELERIIQHVGEDILLRYRDLMVRSSLICTYNAANRFCTT